MEDPHFFSLQGNKGQRLDVVLRIIFVSAFFLTPLFFTSITFSGILFDKWMWWCGLTLVGFVVWIIRGALQGSLFVRRSALDFFILLFLLVAGISTLFGVDIRQSIQGTPSDPSYGLVAFVALAVWYMVFLSSLVAKEEVIFYIKTLVFSLGIAFVYAFLQLTGIFLLPFQLTRTRLFNTVGGIVDMAMVAGIFIPLCMGWAGSMAEGFGAWAAGILFLIVLAYLVMVNVYFVWIGLLVGIAIYLAFLISHRVAYPNRRAVLWMGFATFLVSLLFVSVGSFGLSPSLNLPPVVHLSAQSSFQIITHVFHAHPLFGSGPSTFSYSFSAFRPLMLNQGSYWSLRFSVPSHSWFNLANDEGVIGLLAGIIILFFLSFIFAKRLIRNSHDLYSGWYASLVISFFICLIYSFFNIIHGGVLLIMYSILALALGLLVFEDPSFTHHRRISFLFSPKHSLLLSFLVVLGIAFSVVMATVLVRAWIADVDVHYAFSAPTLETTVAALQHAIILAPWRPDYLEILANAYLTGALNEAQQKKPDPARFEHAASLAVEAATHATVMSPRQMEFWQTLGDIYAKLGSFIQGPYDLAIASYQHASSIEPNNPGLFLRIGDVERFYSSSASTNAERTDAATKAYNAYMNALQLKSDYADAYVGLSHLAEAQGNLDEAIQDMESAARIAPSDVTIHLYLATLYYNNAVAKGDDQTSLARAETEAQQIIIAVPNNLDAYVILGRIYEKQGKISDSKSAFQKALELADDPTLKTSIQQELDALQNPPAPLSHSSPKKK
ncbi:MAG: hypothetical protein KGI50_00895 [Patescibacteria group bacterium]|nr:hypothetical protein [Patescibacteria group bacterium]MDE2438090.1 hypothetical protein [Patescibacteria group bacterium]